MSTNHISDRSLVVLTAAVAPTVTPGVVRSDPKLRTMDYLTAIKSLCLKASPNSFQILLVENTGFDCQEFLDVAKTSNHEIEVLSYRESDEVQRMGKGMGEAAMFDRIGDWIEQREDEFARVIKVTGRLEVKNFNDTLLALPKSKFIRGRFTKDLAMFDTRYFMTSTAEWRVLCMGCQTEVDELNGVYIEHVLARRVRSAIDHGIVWNRFPWSPILRGVSATSGQRYGGVGGAIKQKFSDILVMNSGQRYF